MNNHTPGPWIACDNNGYSIWRVTSPEYRAESASRTVAEVVGDSAETEANARLIAAAPEMYEALQMFLAYNDQGGPLHFDTDAMWAKARSVVAKIEGGGE